MNNIRKANKAIRLGDYYFYNRFDDINAIKNYKKAIKLRYNLKEDLFYKIAKSYKYLGNLEEALKYINIALECSTSYIDGLEFKGKILKELGKDKDSNICFEKVKIIKEKNKNQTINLEEIYKNNKW